ncbi:PIG-L family deacetylase [Candidatus Daviesbacteria bacterium]|nr:PIG-L family deacetylase [Candidatus Daviesbacteria bacterium]
MKSAPSPKTILAVGAHPDDIDIGCSGSISKWIKKGAKAYYLVLTDGSKGSEDPKISHQKLTKLRHAEQKKSANLIGVSRVFFLDFVDGELENTLKLRQKIVKIIRKIKPTTVICFDPTLVYDGQRQFINHPDHRVCGQATLDAVFPYARNIRSFPELLTEGLEPHSVQEVLLINFQKQNFYVDITSNMDLKMAAIGCHQSQFPQMEKFQQRIKAFAQTYGIKAKPKAKYAEGFFKITLR